MSNCPSCEAMQNYSEVVIGDLQNAEAEIRRLRRQVTRLKNELDVRAQRTRDGAIIEEIADYWRERCDHPRATVPIDGARAEAVWARLTQKPEPFTVEQIKRGIDGAKRWPYVGPHGRSQTGNAKQRFDDLELICRNEKILDNFIKLAGMAE